MLKNINKIKDKFDIKYKIENKDVIKYLNKIKFSCKKIYSKYKYNSSILSEKKYRELENNPKIPKYMKKSIRRDCKYENRYSYKNIDICIYSNKKENKKLVNQINSVINMFNFFIDNKDNKVENYKLEILLLKDKKIIHSGFNYPTKINSGLNQFNKILLFREEEIIKVLIHELIHYVNLDIWFVDHKLTDMYKDINIKWIENVGIENCYPNEAYTEAMANIYYFIWSYFYIYLNKNKNSNKSIINYLEDELIKQNIFSLIQVAKICKIQKYKSYNDLFKKDYLQDNRGLSYYIIKSHLLINPRLMECLI